MLLLKFDSGCPVKLPYERLVMDEQEASTAEEVGGRTEILAHTQHIEMCGPKHK